MITLLKKKPCILTIYLLFCLVLTPVYSSDIAEEEDDNEWDVMQPQGDMQTITIDTLKVPGQTSVSVKMGRLWFLICSVIFTRCLLLAACSNQTPVPEVSLHPQQ